MNFIFFFLKSLGQDRQNIQKQNRIYQVVWNDQQEKVLTKQRSQTKQLFRNEIPCSNWNDLGVLPILQQKTLNEKKKQQREHVLNKYTDDDEQLNACLDKEFSQRTTNQVNPDLLFNMGFSLAEQILKHYGRMKSATIDDRLQYIRMKIKKLNKNQPKEKKIIKIIYRILQYYAKHQLNISKEQENLQKKFLMKYQELLNQKLMSRIAEKQFITKLYNYAFEKERKRQNITLNDEENLFLNYPSKQQIANYKQIQPQSTRLKNEKNKRRIFKVNGQTYKHIFHPSTKLLIDKKLECEENKLVIFIQYMLNINKSGQKKFKLGLIIHPSLRQRRNFLKFYSGGLFNQIELEHWKSPNYQPTQTEIKAAIMMQRKLRSLFRVKKLRQKLEKINNCESMIHQIELGQNQQVAYFYLNKSLELCNLQLKIKQILVVQKPKKMLVKTLITGVSTPIKKGIQSLRIAAPSNKIKVDYLFEAVQKKNYDDKIISFSLFCKLCNSQNYDGITLFMLLLQMVIRVFVKWLILSLLLYRQLQNGTDPHIMGQSSPPIDMAKIQNKLKHQTFVQYQKLKGTWQDSFSLIY
ncbi:unnamed protein product [Paramecium sonneborni]|uniref:Uncharacterized protein n=1 Tax=Paramecium sonneborni TaxID=65129 RepID=A0A8S1M0N9_9CILI|nr:unnamed protein product [Paramecium sonneborni]